MPFRRLLPRSKARTFGGTPFAYMNTTILAGGFGPSNLFRGGEPGIWLDPSDLTTLFQDRAGTTPVTAPGQSVGLILDKSRGLVLGPDIETDNWSAPLSGVTYTAGTFTFDGVTSQPNVVFSTNTPSVSIVIGRTYEVKFTIFQNTTNPVGIDVGGVLGGAHTAPGTYTVLITATATTGPQARFRTNIGVRTGSIGNISVRELPGFHAVANSDAARGVYGIEPFGGRRNLLTFTEQFDNAAWSKINCSVLATTDPQQWYFANDGVNVNSILSSAINPSGDAIFAIDIKADTIRYVRLRYGNVTNPTPVNIDAQTGTTDGLASTNVGDGFFRFYLPFTSGADNNGLIQITLSDTYNGTTVIPSASKRVIIRRPQFELGSTATNYQKVVSQYEVTEAGKPTLHYVQFDGADDGYQTPTITPGTDKVQVFAGVRKLSDAATGVLVESSVNYGINSGSFIALAPDSALSGYRFGSSGSITLSNANTAGFVAPITNVLTGLGDIAGDSAILRVNGTQVAQSTVDQGTGNFLAYPLFIGRRGGTTLPFNGRLYIGIVRFGPNLTADLIDLTERLTNQKTGAY